MELAFLVNPVAGYGLLSNLKDSDVLKEFHPDKAPSLAKAREFAALLKRPDLRVLAPSGIMGESLLPEGVAIASIFPVDELQSTSRDTTQFVKSLTADSCDLLVFVGGDGTTRDILDSIDENIPVLGIPAGLKMYSGVFAQSPARAAMVVNSYSKEQARFGQSEVLDLVSSEGATVVKHFGNLKVPVMEGVVSQGKTEYAESDLEDLIDYILSLLSDDKYYIVSTGHTCKHIIERLGYHTDPLGVDILKGRKLVARDVDSEEMLRVAHSGPCTLILSPLGGQNFLFGRGNRQIDATVIKAIGPDNVFIISGQEKMRDMQNLLVDLGEPVMPVYVRVTYGFGLSKMVRIVS